MIITLYTIAAIPFLIAAFMLFVMAVLFDLDLSRETHERLAHCLYLLIASGSIAYVAAWVAH